jgi:hypothetical protein
VPPEDDGDGDGFLGLGDVVVAGLGVASAPLPGTCTPGPVGDVGEADGVSPSVEAATGERYSAPPIERRARHRRAMLSLLARIVPVPGAAKSGVGSEKLGVIEDS